MTTAKPSALRLPDDLPWTNNAGLLLDAVQVEHLLAKLFSWDCTVTVEVLYLQTRFAQFRDISPCLVRLKGQDDALLTHFLANTQEQWGYLLFSDAPWSVMTDHLRWLTTIEHPSGAEMLLRIADPAVAHALLGDTQHSTSRLFGPFQQAVVINAVNDGWNHYFRHGTAPAADYSAPYRLSEPQWSLLEEASFSKMVSELYLHMQEFFRHAEPGLSAVAHWSYLEHLARRSVAYGNDSESDIWLFANAHGLLGDQAMREDPEILELLAPTNPHPEMRMQQISTLAERKCFP
jgi:hypothetical protein